MIPFIHQILVVQLAPLSSIANWQRRPGHSRRGYADPAMAKCVAAHPGFCNGFPLGTQGGHRASRIGAHFSSSRARAVSIGFRRPRLSAAVHSVLDEERASRAVLARRTAAAKFAALQYHYQVLLLLLPNDR